LLLICNSIKCKLKLFPFFSLELTQ